MIVRLDGYAHKDVPEFAGVIFRIESHCDLSKSPNLLV